MMNGEPISRSELAELFREDDRRRAEHAANGKARLPVRETDEAGLLYDGGAPAAAPASQGALCFDEEGQPFISCFTDEQADAIAYALAGSAQELRRDWQDDIERVQQRLLQTVARLVMPAERAEETMYALKDRVARMEGFIERRLAETNADNAAAAGTAATQHAVEVAELRAENRELKGLLSDVLRRFDQVIKAIASIEAKAAAQDTRLGEIKQDVRDELQVLDSKQVEIHRLYTELRMVT
jgi:hypothetical protein